MKDIRIIEGFYNFKARKAQIATMFVVMLGVLLLFTTIVLDIANMSYIKTSMDRAVDNGATMMGSIYTSHAKQMSDQAVEGQTYMEENGGFMSGWLFQVIGWVIVVIGSIISWGSLTGFLVAALLVGCGSWMISEANRRLAVIIAYCDALKLFNTKEAQYRETVLLSTMAASVDDPVKLVDTRDINRDGSTEDWINRFDAHYDQRLRHLILAEAGLDTGGGGGGTPANTAWEAIEAIQEELDGLENNLPDNLVALRQYLSVDFWDLFDEIDAPRYDNATLQTRIEDGERLGHVFPFALKDAIAIHPNYSINLTIWNPAHPHAEVSDDYPVIVGDLCRISDVIYDIYNLHAPTDTNPHTYFLDFINTITGHTVTTLMATTETWLELLYDFTGPRTEIDTDGYPAVIEDA
ncbi:TadE/TadG family type IV pilus assembly protein, partial [Candidatus Omnitrophota bacterium]